MMARTRPLLCFLAIGALLNLAMSACGSGNDAAAGSGDFESTLQVQLRDSGIDVSLPTVAAGEVTFEVTNLSSRSVHQLSVVRTGDPAELPADEAGSARFDQEALAGETALVDLGQGTTLELDLDPGTYILLCNFYERDETQPHYSLGQHTSLTVVGQP